MYTNRYVKAIALSFMSLCTLALASCNSSGVATMIQASGRPGEVMLVMNKADIETHQAYKLLEVLEQPAPSLPQVEQSLQVTSRIGKEDFSSMMRRGRNILVVDVDKERYSKSTLKFGYNEWAKGQIIVTLNTPSLDSLAVFAKDNEETLQNLFVRHEIYRFGYGLEQKSSQRANELVDSLFAHRINVPADINKHKFGKNFLWMSNAKMNERSDLMVYTFPYAGRRDLEIDRLVEVRDSVLKANIEGGVKGSYPSTVKTGLSYRHVTPEGKPRRAELRGLWQMEGGDMMGGPFVLQAYHNEADGLVYVFEGFVYRPNENKLNMVRTMEAALYSVRPSAEKTFSAQSILSTKYTKSF